MSCELPARGVHSKTVWGQLYCGIVRVLPLRRILLVLSMPSHTSPDNHPEPLVQNDRLEQHRSGSVIVYHSPESKSVAAEIGEYSDRCNHYLAELFGDDEPAGQNVYWLTSADWLNPPETYGFPYNVGPNALLAAADAELPTQLALIADFMSLEDAGDDVAHMADLLGLDKGPDVGQRVYDELTKSKQFFVDYTLGFIMPHEMTHGYCQARGFPESPRWYYEGIAQWSAYHMQHQMRSEREAEMIYAYYQLLWNRVGDRLKVPDFEEADRLGHLNLDTPNYAWYHAGLLRMFRELERRKGANLLPELLHSVGRNFRGREEVANDPMISVFSNVVGEDLTSWFQQTWNLG